MSAFKGTPGPWEVEEDERLGLYRLLNFSPRDQDEAERQHEANIHLFEAAPALLDAAEKVYGHAAIMLGGGGTTLLIEALKQLKMAMDQALGEGRPR